MSENPEGAIKIALIEPDAKDSARIKELVKTGSVPAEVADAMTSASPDLAKAEIILLSLHRLDATGKELLARLHAGFPETPLVVLSGSDAAAWASEAVRLGAQHVLPKSELTPEKISSTLRYYVHYTQGRKRPVAAPFSATLPVSPK
ncbi:MAG: hypothetical protein ABL955_09370 [Elusimicrobiota bacterium]